MKAVLKDEEMDAHANHVAGPDQVAPYIESLIMQGEQADKTLAKSEPNPITLAGG